MKRLVLDGESLTLFDVHDAVTFTAEISFSPRSVKQMNKSRALVDEWVKKEETVYGVTTGFGEFSNVRIGKKDLERLQENLILSHSAGTGDLLPAEIVRAMMILRMNALAKGYSGISIETMESLRAAYNSGIVPVIPSRGSVGSSGDLAPLAHLVLALIGRGEVFFRGKRERASAALRKARLRPAKLTAKEGLALVNGTQMMSAYGCLATVRALDLCKLADIAAAMSTEALKGSDTPFDARIHKVRPHAGQRASARNLRILMKGSQIRESHRKGDNKVQDAYSLRCAPQVHGASRDAIKYVAGVLQTEINSATDNPLIFAKDKTHLEGGNFHGQPVAISLDLLGIALAELANISERRIERMVNGSLSGLPRFLAEKGGLHSGLMITQYTAASLVSENKVLAHPASVDSIPTSANQEDHNSMGSIAAHKAWQILKNTQTVLAIELMVAAQGVDFSRIGENGKMMHSGKGIEAAHHLIRSKVKHLKSDRIIHDDIESTLALVQGGRLISTVEHVVGRLE